jgi:hypothetical protein
MIEVPHSTDIDVYLRQPCYLAPSKLTKAPMYYWSASHRTQNAHRIIGGPEQFRLDELVRRRLAVLKDPREVIADPNARYSGAKVSEKTLVPGNNARLGETRYETWLTQPAAQIPSAHPKPNAA